MTSNNIKKLALLLLVIFGAVSVQAQSIRDIKINEVLVDNDSLNRDMFGKTKGWIELHNTGYARLNVGGCYLSLRKKDISKEGGYLQEFGVTYRIPPNVPDITTIAPRGYMMIFAEGVSSLGPQYTNFVLDEADYLVLTDASGKIILDEITIDQSKVRPNVSFGRDVVPYGEVGEMLEFTLPTPGCINIEPTAETASDRLIAVDPSGGGMAMIAMSIVFIALICLFLIFKNIGKGMIKYEKREKQKAASPESAPAAGSAPAAAGNDEDASAEVIAAISLAVIKYQEDLDRLESNVLTINKVAKVYSPWSSKIYGLTQLPNRR